MDRIDKKILHLLQTDAGLQIAEIAQQVGISTSPCWRRIRKLEEQGVIRARVMLLDKAKLNLGLTALIRIKTQQHDVKWLEKFAEAVVAMPEVVDFYRMTGETDYVIRMVVPDMKAYDLAYKRLISRVEIFDVSASFVMEEIKSTTALPLDYAG
jgi:Lrp/AsnC family transcriptional regulator